MAAKAKIRGQRKLNITQIEQDAAKTHRYLVGLKDTDKKECVQQVEGLLAFTETVQALCSRVRILSSALTRTQKAAANFAKVADRIKMDVLETEVEE